MNSHTKSSVKPQEHYKLNPLKNKDGWCISDFSLDSTDRIVLSGSKHSTRETFIKVFSIYTQSKPKCLYSRDFNRQENPEQWRLVSFLDNINLVSCHGNQIDKISIRNDKIVQSKKLTTNGASCISVKGGKTFIGFSKSSCIAVLNSNLHQTSTITLSALQDGWPVDLMMVPDTILVCSFGCVPRRALSFTEKDGQLSRGYTNPRSDDSVPLSLTVSVETDLVAVLWNSPPQLTIHSFSHGYCLVVADVEPAERVRSVGQDKLVMVDEKGEMKVFQMGQFFTLNNLKATLSCLLSCEDCKELGDFFGLPFNQRKQRCGTTASPSETVIEDDQYSEVHKLDFFKCLEKNNKIHNGDVTDLIRAFKQLEKGRTILDPLEAYEKYVGDCESGCILDSEGTSHEQDGDERSDDDGATQEPSGDEDEMGNDVSTSQELDVDERGDAGSKRRHSRDDQSLANASFKRKRSERNNSNADNEPLLYDQVGLVESIKRVLKEAVDPLMTEIQSLKQQNDLMMCYLRTQPLQHSSSHRCSCIHQCQPLLAQSCSQVHAHGCNHLVQSCANLHVQYGNGVPPNSQPNLPQHSQQPLMIAQLPPYQPMVHHPQVVSYPNPPFHVQPYRQLLPPQSTQLQALPNYHPNPPVNLQPPDLRQPTTTTSQPSTQSSGQYPFLNTGLQTPVQTQVGIASTHPVQGYHTPDLNGTTNTTDGFGSPPSLQAISNVPPQGGIQSTPTQQQVPVVPQDSSRPTGDHHNGTQPSTMSTPSLQSPYHEEVLTLPSLPKESSPTLGQGGSGGASSSLQEVRIPTKLSDLPRIVQLKLLPLNGQRTEQNRQSVTKILLKYFFSHDERLTGNISGRRGYKQLRQDKLLGMKDLIFKICPLDGEEGEADKEREWSELCKLIDVNNRRYRNELKRGARSRKKSQQLGKR